MKKLNFLCVVILAMASSAKAIEFNVTNLVTDDQTVNAAVISDSGAKNSWGITFTTSSPFWVSANGSGVANVYQVMGNVPTKQGLTVTIPGDGTITGQVSNANTANTPLFNGDNFLFVSEDGSSSDLEEDNITRSMTVGRVLGVLN